MRIKTKYALGVLLAIVVLGLLVVYLKDTNIAVLEPKGSIGRQEKHLIIEAGLISLIVVLPVFALASAIALKYRATNVNAAYRPDWDHNRLMELTWWAIPGIIIFVLSIIAWNSAHALDPFKQLSTSGQTLNIQVVSLDWKWLFIYPHQNIATVNLVEIPTNTDVNFELTSDSVMNSFWVPALGSQIYAMPGMSTQLHLLADQTGSYRGLSANISGVGFAGMDFTARAVNQDQFSQWIKTTQAAKSQLSQANYRSLAKPSQNNSVAYYSQPDPNLYNSILSKYVGPALFPGQVSHG